MQYRELENVQTCVLIFAGYGSPQSMSEFLWLLVLHQDYYLKAAREALDVLVMGVLKGQHEIGLYR